MEKKNKKDFSLAVLCAILGFVVLYSAYINRSVLSLLMALVLFCTGWRIVVNKSPEKYPNPDYKIDRVCQILSSVAAVISLAGGIFHMDALQFMLFIAFFMSGRELSRLHENK